MKPEQILYHTFKTASSVKDDYALDWGPYPEKILYQQTVRDDGRKCSFLAHACLVIAKKWNCHC